MRFTRALTTVALAGGLLGVAAMPASAATQPHYGGGVGWSYNGPIHAGKAFGVSLDGSVEGYKGLIVACMSATDNLNKPFKRLVCTKAGHKEVKLTNGHATLGHTGNWLLATEVDKVVTVHGRQVLVPLFSTSQNPQLVHVSR
ncbi:hypothetical protein [Streptacidiphilus melanogenes]|uniref:hypothetical protein n=1 Tax=Streptacidiphilus melanogenes TaxID=411235 RepID=UPI0005AB3DCE|nr:hypothetical protein [Streptacidiphilus melanogenes]